jgi:hypothetical protein
MFLHNVVITNVAEEHAASIFRLENLSEPL